MTATQTISTATALPVLADQQRRRVIHPVVESNDPAEVDQLAEAAFPNTPWEPTELRDQVTLELPHIQRPILQEAGPSGHDTSRGAIQHHSDAVSEER
jgi:hypothetical protein